jgi:hypothetical protein
MHKDLSPKILAIPAPISKLMPDCLKIIATYQELDFTIEYLDTNGERREYDISFNGTISNTKTKVAMEIAYTYLEDGIYLRNGDASLLKEQDIAAWKSLSIQEITRRQLGG